MARRTAAWALAAVVIALFSARAEAVDLKINPPSVDEGEVSFEDNSVVALRKGASPEARHTHFFELAYGVADYWWTEVEGHWESGNDGFKLRTVDVENAFRLVQQGEYWPESALFVEYDQLADGRSPNSLTLGGLFRKDIDRWSTVLNVLFDHDVGHSAEPGTRLRYIGTSTWSFAEPFAPGVEFFGQPGRPGHFTNLGGQDHRLGPVVIGAVDVARAGEFGYALGYLVGLTPRTPRGTLVWRLEFDTRF
jgi:hypothetical protein